MKYLLEKTNDPVWITGQAYKLPVVFDFSRYLPEFSNPNYFSRVIVRLKPFDLLPVLDNANSQKLGLYLPLYHSVKDPTSSPQKIEFINALGELWALTKREYLLNPDMLGSFSYNITIGNESYYTMALLTQSLDEISTRRLICFGIQDGDSRRPDMAVISGIAKIEADKSVYDLFNVTN